jgi:hypothetical protein
MESLAMSRVRLLCNFQSPQMPPRRGPADMLIPLFDKFSLKGPEPNVFLKRNPINISFSSSSKHGAKSRNDNACNDYRSCDCV